MIAGVFHRRIRLCQGLHDLVFALVGIAGLRAIVALSEGSRAGTGIPAAAFQWVLCAASLFLIAVSEWHVRERHPGITSLFRRFSYGALAGALLPTAAGLIFSPGCRVAPPFLAALLGLALTLASAVPLNWLFMAPGEDLPALPESEALARLKALIEMLQRTAHPQTLSTPLCYSGPHSEPVR